MERAEFIALLQSSPIFDGDWYQERYGPFVGAPFEHFVDFGESEGKSPGPSFDPAVYLALNPDLAGQLSPTFHYLKYGQYDDRAMTVFPSDRRWLEFPQRRRHVNPVIRDGEFLVEPLREELSYRHGANSVLEFKRRLEKVLDLDLYKKLNGDVQFDVYEPLWHKYRFYESDDRKHPKSVDFDGQFGVINASKPDSCAVFAIVHLFYADLADELLERISWMPSSCTVLIGVRDLESQNHVRQRAEELLSSERVIVEIVENRGRNFASIRRFSGLISPSSIVLHLHSKKSLYTGTEQNQWRRGILDSLVPNRSSINAVINLFKSVDDLAVVAPFPSDSMPHWACHRLQNQNSLRQLDPDTDYSGFLEYPVGGMFWCRGRVIQSLAKLCDELEFEEEPIPADGALPHALERIVTQPRLIGNSKSLYVDLVSRRLSTSLHPWIRNHLPSQAVLEQRLFSDTQTVISVDLFDTLVRRRDISPEVALFNCYRNLGFDPSEVEEFIRTRGHAESELRHTLRSEPPLPQFLQLAIDRHGGRFAEYTGDQLAREELLFELQGLEAIPWLVELLRKVRDRGNTLILVTDTYYSRPNIEYLLDGLGLSKLFDALFVSSELNLRKDSGTVWPYVLSSFEGREIFHIGDNPAADCQRAGDVGIQNFHVLNFVDYATLAKEPSHEPVVKKISKVRKGLAGVVWNLVHELGGANYNESLNDQVSKASEVATVEDFARRFLFPLVLLQTSSARFLEATTGKSLIYLARDGDLPYKCLQVSSRLDSQAVRSSYLPISRATALAANLNDDPSLLCNGNFVGTVGELIEGRIGVSREGLVRLAPGSEAFLDQLISLPSDRQVAERAFVGLRGALLDYARIQERAIIRLANHNDIAANSIVVDIGYSGTTQLCLQKVLKTPIHGLYLATSTDISQVFSRGSWAIGLVQDFGGWDQGFLRESLLFEAFLSEDVGSVLALSTSEDLDHARLMIREEGVNEHVLEANVVKFCLADRRSLPSRRVMNYAHEVVLECFEKFWSSEFVSPDGIDALQLFCRSALTSLHLGRTKLSPEFLKTLEIDDRFSGVDIRHWRSE